MSPPERSAAPLHRFFCLSPRCRATAAGIRVPAARPKCPFCNQTMSVDMAKYVDLLRRLEAQGQGAAIR
jgi:hypothetical protein